MNNFKTTLSLMLLLAAVGVFNITQAKEKVEEERPLYEIHSMMIYNFIKYIQWPDQGTQEFVIGVVGDQDVYNTLKTWYDGKVRGNKKFSIKMYNSPADIQESEIIYVAKSSSGQFDTIKDKAGTSTLLITDKPGLGQKGSGINFKTVNSKLAFELNEAVIQNSNLKVSSQLTAMAILI